MTDVNVEDDGQLDGCAIEFDDPEYNTEDGEQQDAVVMFADCFDDPEAVEQRRAELVEWAAAVEEEPDA
jgi:hypothetical protein